MRIEGLVDAMTLEEQVSLLSGADFWSLPVIDRLGLGKLRMTDGPNGARGGGTFIGGVKSASFPVGIALGATWSAALVHEIALALACEVKSKGAHVSLSPTLNIQRSVANGRNFECFSEDPILTARMAEAFVAGLQAEGIAATIKHFAGNESEVQRFTMSSEIDERTLREVYLVPFEAAVKQGAWAVMSGYNRLNGTFASESNWLLTQVLRRDWGFDGVVMSDWFGSHSTVPTINAGVDIEMPGPTRDRGEKLVAAVKSGEISATTVRGMAKNVLRLMERTGALDDHRPHEERAEDRPEHRALIRRAGTEAIVLLKNDGILPLSAAGRIAVIGPNASVAQIMGGGSAQLNPHYRISPLEGLAAALGADRLDYCIGATNDRFEPLVKGRFAVDYFSNRDLSGPPAHSETQDSAEALWFGEFADGKVDPRHFSARFTGTFTASQTGLHQVGLFSAGRSRVYIDRTLVADAWSQWTRGRTFSEEGCDEVIGRVPMEAGRSYGVVVEYATHDFLDVALAAFRCGIGLPLGDAAIAEAAALAAHCEVALLFVGRNGDWDTEGSDLPDIALPGLQDALVAAVAAANPRTVVILQSGGPVEMPWIDAVAGVLQAWYPGQEAGNAIADVLTGRAEPGGRLPQSFPVRWRDNPTSSADPEVYPGQDGKVRYAEGVFVGYRHYEAAGVAPLFPFGFGLSYTGFSLDSVEVDASRFEADGKVGVSMRVTNIGERAGSTVVQVYISDPVAGVPRPAKELKAFAKVALNAGETRTVALNLTARDFAFFDIDTGVWCVESGDFALHLGWSSAEIVVVLPLKRETELRLPI